jgi:hypothetical protein
MNSTEWQGIRLLWIQKAAGESSEHTHPQHEIVISGNSHSAIYGFDGQKRRFQVDR